MNAQGYACFHRTTGQHELLRLMVTLLLALHCTAGAALTSRPQIYFVREFDLVDERELAPMAELIEELVPPKATGGTAALAGVAEGDGF